MEPAETIVNAWLQTNGYFTMNNIRVDKSGHPGKKPEIDILAIKFDPSKNCVTEKLHVEVSVSVHQFGKSTKGDFKKMVEKKFFDKWKMEHIKKYFGNGYQKVLVVSDQSLTEEIGDLLTSKGVTCYKFSKIISDLKKLMRNKSYDDDARRFLGLVFEHECT